MDVRSLHNLALSEIYEAAAAEFITGRQLMLPILAVVPQSAGIAASWEGAAKDSINARQTQA